MSVWIGNSQLAALRTALAEGLDVLRDAPPPIPVGDLAVGELNPIVGRPAVRVPMHRV